jgi:hypothetical protein
LSAEHASDLSFSNVRSLSQENWALADAELREIRLDEAQSRIIFLFLVFLFIRLVLVNIRHPVGGDIRKALHIGGQLREPSQHLISFRSMSSTTKNRWFRLSIVPARCQCPSSSSLVHFRPCCLTQAMI